MSRVSYYQTVPPTYEGADRAFEVEMQLPTQSFFGQDFIREDQSFYQFPEGIEQSKGYFLKFCSLISGLTALVLMLTIILHGFCIVVSTELKEPKSFYELIYRLYGLAFAVIAFFCEMEWTDTIRTTSLLQYWTTRGLFYVFIGLLSIQEYGNVSFGKYSLEKEVLFLEIGLIILGIIYTLMVYYNLSLVCCLLFFFFRDFFV